MRALSVDAWGKFRDAGGRTRKRRTACGSPRSNRRKATRLVGALLALSATATASPYKLVTVAEGLDFPWCVAFLPDGAMLVTELGGTLRRISPNGDVGDPISGVPAVHRQGQGGLFDVLPHRDFAENRTVFLSYAALPAEDNATEILRARLVDGALTDAKVIFAVTPRKPTPVHYGGRMAFLADDTLVLTTGDGFDFREAAQDLNSLMGKTVRIDIDGGVPADNPLIDRDDALPQIYSYGHRNPQGLAPAPDGTLYLHEHGARGGDETNRVIPGANYGWPAVTHGIDYIGALISPFQEAPGMTPPLHVWTPSIAPSGLAVYAGERFPAWRGDLFVGALVDREVRRLDIEDGAIVGEEELFGELGRRIRDVRSHDGYLYIVEDGPDARIVRVEPVEGNAEGTSASNQDP